MHSGHTHVYAGFRKLSATTLAVTCVQSGQTAEISTSRIEVSPKLLDYIQSMKVGEFTDSFRVDAGLLNAWLTSVDHLYTAGMPQAAAQDSTPSSLRSSEVRPSNSLYFMLSSVCGNFCASVIGYIGACGDSCSPRGLVTC